MTDLSKLTDAQLQAIAAQQGSSSPASGGTSPLPVDASANFDVRMGPNGIYAGPNGESYFPDPHNPGYLTDNRGTLYRATTPADFGHLSDRALEQIANSDDPGKDALASIGPGLGKAAAGIVGMGGDAINLWHNGTLALGNSIRNLVTGHHADYQPDNIAGTHGEAIPLPNSGDVNDTIQRDFGAYYEPQTWAGRATEAFPSFATAAALPGSLGARIARAAVPFLASDAAGEGARILAPGDANAEGWARFGGGILGGGAQGLFEHANNAPLVLAKKMMPDASDANIAAAQGLMTDARNLPNGGINLTFPEAYTAVNGGALNRIQHYIENSALGGPRVKPLFDARPQEVSNVASGLADVLAPRTDQPGQLGADVQGAASGALGKVRKSINTQATPHYDALDTQNAYPFSVSAALADPRTGPSLAKALETFRGNPELSGPYAGAPDTNLGLLNQIEQRLGTMADQVAPTELNRDVGDPQLSANRQGAASVVNSIGRASSPDWRAARDIVANRSAAELAPLRAGALGNVAGTPDLGAQTSALFRPAHVGGAAETATALGHIGGQSPELVPQITAQYLRDTANSALADLQPGPNQWGGAKLAVALGGKPESRAALLNGIEASGQDPAQFDRALQVLAATGRRLQPGSGTYFNEELAKQFGTAPVVQPISITDPLEYGRPLGRMFGDMAARHKMNALASWLEMSPEDAAAFARKARGASDAPALATALIAGRAGAQQP